MESFRKSECACIGGIVSSILNIIVQVTIIALIILSFKGSKHSMEDLLSLPYIIIGVWGTINSIIIIQTILSRIAELEWKGLRSYFILSGCIMGGLLLLTMGIVGYMAIYSEYLQLAGLYLLIAIAILDLLLQLSNHLFAINLYSSVVLSYVLCYVN